MARGMIEIAQQRLALHYPFHTRFVAVWRLCSADAVRSVAVTVDNEVITLLFNPAFICSCTLPELMGVLHHEVNHVLFGHMFADRCRYPDRVARLIAEEVTANEWVPEPLPGEPIVLARFRELPAGEDTETRYQRLAGNCGLMHGKGLEWYQNRPCRDRKRPAADPKAAPTGKKADLPVATLDDHDIWNSIKSTAVLARLVIQASVSEAFGHLTPAEAARLPAVVRQQIEQLCGGQTPGKTIDEMPAPSAFGGQLDWRKVLRGFVARATEVRPLFNRPPRRFPELVGVIPGRVRRPSKARVMAVIDTSGSIDRNTLEMVSVELELMSRGYEVAVVECDAAIQATYEYAGPIAHVRGRGGTDLRPPLDADVLRNLRPDIVVYFTDGRGPAPEMAPIVPVMWCLTPRGVKPAPWGREIRMVTAGSPETLASNRRS